MIATDVSLVDAKTEYAEPAMGTGGAAVLVGDKPRVLTADFGAFGNYSYETMDSARPTPQFDFVDVDKSLFSYIDCLTNSFEDDRTRVQDAHFVSTFDYLAMHTPFSGLVKADTGMMCAFAKASVDHIRRRFCAARKAFTRLSESCGQPALEARCIWL